MGAQSQTQQTQQIDKRAILAVIKAVEEINSFVIPYGVIMDELSEMIENDDEYYKVEDGLYDALYVGKLKYVYNIYQFDDSSADLIVVSPIELSKEQLQILHEVASVYAYEDKAYDAVKTVINNLIEKWASNCLEVKKPATAVFVLAKEYGLNIKVIEDETKREPYTGKIIYNIDGVVNVVRHVLYCNNCINGEWFGGTFIEKCDSWEFEDNDEQDTTEVSGYD
jgi:hypothetical protein